MKMQVLETSSGEFATVHLASSRSGICSNPIRQADINWHLTCIPALGVIWICCRTVSPRVYDLIGRLIYVGNYSIARSDARLRVPNELWVLISDGPMKGETLSLSLSRRSLISFRHRELSPRPFSTLPRDSSSHRPSAEETSATSTVDARMIASP